VRRMERGVPSEVADAPEARAIPEVQR